MPALQEQHHHLHPLNHRPKSIASIQLLLYVLCLPEGEVAQVLIVVGLV